MARCDPVVYVRMLQEPPRQPGDPLQVRQVSVCLEGSPFQSLPDTTRIWRYLTFAKFASLLCEKTLWFSRVDLLGDPFEGSSPWPSVDRRATAQPGEEIEIEAALRVHRRWVVVNCWSLLPVESDALWRLYARNDDGIAVQTTIGTLIGQIRAMDPLTTDAAAMPRAVSAGAVWYADYRHFEIVDPTPDPMHRFFLKRLAFAHEQEYRVVAALPDLCTLEGVVDEPLVKGLAFPIDPAALITEVVVAPLAPGWYEQAVRRTVLAFAPTLSVRRSTLAEPPRY